MDGCCLLCLAIIHAILPIIHPILPIILILMPMAGPIGYRADNNKVVTIATVVTVVAAVVIVTADRHHDRHFREQSDVQGW